MPLSRPAPGAPTVEQLTRRYPKHLPAAAVIGNSQTRYLFQHFDAYARSSPAFITIRGATTFDIEKELSNVPRSITTLIFHVGTSELERFGCEETLRRLRRLVNKTLQARPELQKLVVSLVLPRSTNRRLDQPNDTFVHWFNHEARQFNDTVKSYCRKPGKVSYLDHDFTSLPPRRFLAADGLHPSFSGVALLAQNLKGLLQRGEAPTPPGWSSEIPAATNPIQEARTIPRMHPHSDARMGAVPWRPASRPVISANVARSPAAALSTTPAGDVSIDIEEYPTPAESLTSTEQSTPVPQSNSYYLRNTTTRHPHPKK